MVFDGFLIYHLITELNHRLEKARLEKIYQTSEMSFVFVFYLKGERMNLDINVSSHDFGFHLTSKKAESNASSQFLNTLKKHLEGAILQKINQYETDRVILFDFIINDFIDGQIHKTLVFEAMGKHSNLLLVQDQIIVDTFKKMFFEEGRQLLPQAQFEFFPSDKVSFFNLSYEKIFSYMDLVNQYMGISPFLAKYLFEHQQDILKIEAHPTRNLTDRKDYVFDIFDSNAEKKNYNSISEMMDDKLEQSTSSQSSHAIFIKKQLKKMSTLKEHYQNTIEKAQIKLLDKEKGDLIYQSGHLMKEKTSSLTVDDHTLLLDPTLTLNENAQNFYKSYQKAKRTILQTQRLLKKHEQLINLFEEFETYLDLSANDSLKDFEQELIPYGYKSIKVKPQHKKQVKKPNIIKIVDEQSTIYVGKNSLQNEYITHQLGNKNDFWFHVKDFPGAHVLVIADELNEAIIRKAAMLAAQFSSLKYSSSIPVDYTQIKHIKKISGRPGYHVTYKNHQTIYIDIDEQKLNDYLKNV